MIKKHISISTFRKKLLSLSNRNILRKNLIRQRLNSVGKIFILLLTCNFANSQCSEIFYNTPQFDNSELWELNFEIKTNWLQGNYSRACALANQIDTNIVVSNQINFSAIISSFSHEGEKALALKWIELANKHSRLTCLEPTASKYILSDSIYESDEFKKFCPNFPVDDLHNISHPELRDSIIKYIIYTHNGLRLQSFIDMGYGNYYNNIPDLGFTNLKEIAWQKISDMFLEHGYPTEQMIGRRDILMVVFLFIAHQPETYKLEKFREEMICKVPPMLLALLDDKIAISQNKKQKYGTQFIRTDNGSVLCEVLSRKDIDTFRMNVGLSPISSYITKHGLKWE